MAEKSPQKKNAPKKGKSLKEKRVEKTEKRANRRSNG